MSRPLQSFPDHVLEGAIHALWDDDGVEGFRVSFGMYSDANLKTLIGLRLPEGHQYHQRGEALPDKALEYFVFQEAALRWAGIL